MELFKLFGTIAVNNSDANAEIDATTGKAESAGSKIGTVFEKIGSAAVVAAKATAVAIGAGVTAIAGLTKASVEAYADFEQLTGGVETLFGAGGQTLEEYAASAGKTVDEVSDEYNKLMKAQTSVFASANEAYKSCGLSANEYMENVTSFSAALISSVGGDTEKAAEKADQAMIQMADNANKMGSSMESIQNAYSGFAKQNYTMLDNLKLGYGGTQEEMKRLLADAQAISGVKYDISSYADIVDAIKVVQDEMGITGTTAKEAESTISGSLGMVKAAWENVLTGFASGDGNLDDYLDSLMSSVQSFVNNVVPVASWAIQSIIYSIKKYAPQLLKMITGMMNEILPAVIDGAIGLVDALVEVLPQFVQAIVDALPQFIDGAMQIMMGLINALPTIIQVLCDALPVVLPQLITAIALLTAALCKQLPEIIQIIVEMLPELFTVIVDTVWGLLSQLLEKLDEWIQPLLEWVSNLIDKITTPLKEAWNTISNIVQVGILLVKEILNAALQILLIPWNFIWENFGDEITAFFNKVSEWFNQKRDEFIEWFELVKMDIEEHLQPIVDFITGIFNTVSDFVSGVTDKIYTKVSDIFGKIKGVISDNLNDAKKIVTDIFGKIKDSISEKIQGARDSVKSAIDKIKGFFNFSWSLPKLKLPHPTITGSFSLNPPSVPHFSIDWYKKAMDDPMIMTQPTAFGMNSKGQIMAGGEAGSEVVSGTNTLMEMISGAVDSKNQEIIDSINRLLEFLQMYIPDMANMQLVMDSGVIVGELAPEMDAALGKLAIRNGRGV